MKAKAYITFLPIDKKIPIESENTLLELAHIHNIPIQAVCGGKKSCGKCKVRIISTRSPLPSPTEREKEILGDILLRKGYRLACELVLQNDTTVYLPDETLTSSIIALTDSKGRDHPLALRPDIQSYGLKISQSDFSVGKCDLAIIRQKLYEEYGIRDSLADTLVLEKIPSKIRKRSQTYCIFKGKKEILDMVDKPEVFGMAFDIGTTTVVGYIFELQSGRLLNIQSALNPQIQYGTDIITRIGLCQQDRKNLHMLHSLIIECINRLIDKAIEPLKIKKDMIYEIVVVGNTAMHHLFLGIDPTYLSIAPYLPVFTDPFDIKAKRLGIDINPNGYIHLLPLKAGFVGSDAIACCISCGIHRSKKIDLLLDIGTNGEIVFGNRDRILCCSAAAGPAFEGGQIQWGMIAKEGAIEKVKIDRSTLSPNLMTIGNREPVGICGSGLISLVAEMLRVGIIDERGRFNSDLKNPRIRQGRNGWEYVLVFGKENDIVITQKDISELQMAKAAIRAGIQVLMEIYEVKGIHNIYLAGAGGNYIDPDDAIIIGLFPDQLSGKVIPIGNGAGKGACISLLNINKRREAFRISKSLEYVELSGNPRFNEHFINYMLFPVLG